MSHTAIHSLPGSLPGSRSSSRRTSFENLRAPPLATTASFTATNSQGGSNLLAVFDPSVDKSGEAAPASVEPAHLPIEYTAISAHKQSYPAFFRYIFLSILSGGLVPLLCVYLPWLRTRLIRTRCAHFRDADYVLVGGDDGTWLEIQVDEILASNHPLLNPFEARVDQPASVNSHYANDHIVNVKGYARLDDNRDLGLDGPVQAMRRFKYFTYRKQRYVFQEGANTFVRVNSKLHVLFESVHPLRRGLSEKEAETLLARNGENLIQVDSVSIPKMLFDKVVHPFYIFQAFSVAIWMFGDYFVYSYIILITSIASIAYEIYQSKQNELSLRELLHQDTEVTVLRNNGSGTVSVPTRIQAQHLVVGDAIIVESGVAVADIVLVQGDCVVDESGLTGESVPVVKSSLGYFDNKGQVFSVEKAKGSVVFCGARVLEVKPSLYVIPEIDGYGAGGEMVVGVVVATGFHSTKGELFRGIMYPSKIDFKFYKDATFFIGVLGFIAIAAYIGRVYRGIKDGYGSIWLFLTALDLITIAVPPALPLVLTVGVSQAVNRLKKLKIYCIQPDRINHAGRLDTFCWDKTGTLTSQSVTFAGIERTHNSVFTGYKSRLRRDGDGDLERALASCHGLNNVNGELIGSSVDKELFGATRYRLVQDEPTVMWNGHIFPVIARVFRPVPHVTPTPQSSPVTGFIPPTPTVTSSMASSPYTPTPSDSSPPHKCPTLTIPILPILTSGLIASPSAATPLLPTSASAPESLLILRRFDFDAKLQRASVIYKPTASRTLLSPLTPKPTLPWEALTVVTKGSPEAIRNLCVPESIPEDYHATYTRHAMNGWYVLAVASRVLGEAKHGVEQNRGNRIGIDPVASQHLPVSEVSGTNEKTTKLKKSNSLRAMLHFSERQPAQSSLLRTNSVKNAAGKSISQTKVEQKELMENVVVTCAEDLAAITRDRVERGMKFLGFILLENPIKRESIGVVSKLANADIRSVIITGDNVMTAINVARKLNLCKNVLLIDKYDDALGFRRLTYEESDDNSVDHIPTEKQTNNQAHHLQKTHFNHASSIDSLPILDLAPKSPQTEDELSPLTIPVPHQPSVPKIRIRSSSNASTSFKQAHFRHRSPSPSAPTRTYPIQDIPSLLSPSTSLALTGTALDMLLRPHPTAPSPLPFILLKTSIFARMSPAHKSTVITRLMGLGLQVGMCGDGANDAGALKAAHVGVALSDAEVSVVAPFTSGARSVEDVVVLVREGRAALDTSFMSFKYMLLYPLIQLTAIILLSTTRTTYSSTQFLFDDLCVLLLAYFQSLTPPSPNLSRTRPAETLFSATVIYSVMGHAVICAAGFAVVWMSLGDDPLYCPAVKAMEMLNMTSFEPINASAALNATYPCYIINPTEDISELQLTKSQETTVLFLFSHFLYAALSFSLSLTPPHRPPLTAFKNPLYILVLVFLILLMELMQLTREGWVAYEGMQGIFGVVDVSVSTRMTGICMAVLCGVFGAIWEVIVIGRFISRVVDARDRADRKKIEVKIGTKSGFSGGDLEDSSNGGKGTGSGAVRKWNALQAFGKLAGIKDNNGSWEGYVQSVAATASMENEHREIRLEMAAGLKNTRSWGDMTQQEEINVIGGVTRNTGAVGERETIGERFEVERGRKEDFAKGFEAWR